MIGYILIGLAWLVALVLYALWRRDHARLASLQQNLQNGAGIARRPVCEYMRYS